MYTFLSIVSAASVMADGTRNLFRLVKTKKEDPNKATSMVWAGRDLNPRPPPCQGGILTKLDHRPYSSSKNHATVYNSPVYGFCNSHNLVLI